MKRYLLTLLAVTVGIWLLWLRSSSEIPLSPLACVDNKPISRLMSVDSESPGRNRGIVLRCSHPTYPSIVADPFPRPLPVGRKSIFSPSYEREGEKTWDSYSKYGRSCRLSPIDTNERNFLHTLVRKRPLGLSRSKQCRITDCASAAAEAAPPTQCLPLSRRGRRLPAASAS